MTSEDNQSGHQETGPTKIADLSEVQSDSFGSVVNELLGTPSKLETLIDRLCENDKFKSLLTEKIKDSFDSHFESKLLEMSEKIESTFEEKKLSAVERQISVAEKISRQCHFRSGCVQHSN